VGVAAAADVSIAVVSRIRASCNVALGFGLVAAEANLATSPIKAKRTISLPGKRFRVYSITRVNTYNYRAIALSILSKAS
jgi:hypothetical protein